MRAEELMSCIEDRKLQRVDDSSDGIDNSARHQPCKGRGWKRFYQRNHHKDTEPAHGDIDEGGKPFGAGNPEHFNQDADSGCSPYKRQKGISDRIPQCDDADGRIAACNQNKNHHMIHLPQNLIGLFRNIKGVVNGACSIEENHAECEYRKGQYGKGVTAGSRNCQQRGGCKGSQNHSDKMGKGAAWIFDR